MAEQSAETVNHAIKAMTIKTGKYLTFILAEEEYGIGILKVKEIIGMMPITTIPRTPQFVKGVINLRGKVIPIIDLRLKFNLEAIPYSERTCIIVVEIDSGETTVLIGIVVDAVSEVLNIREDEIEETPKFGTKLNYRIYPWYGKDTKKCKNSSQYRSGIINRGDQQSQKGVLILFQGIYYGIF